MKKTITISVDIDVVKELQNENNISGLINDLLKNHFNKKYTSPQDNTIKEQAIIDEVKRAMQEEQFMNDVKAYMLDWTAEKQTEYLEGIKEKKWNGTVEFAKIKVTETFK